LPDFNLGTAGGASADADLSGQVFDVLSSSKDFKAVHNGRFKGGFITRHYGQPEKGIHALQLETTQSCYMDEEPPFAFRTDLAMNVEPVIEQMLKTALSWALSKSE
jgi:N-formylglutamate deformylase